MVNIVKEEEEIHNQTAKASGLERQLEISALGLMINILISNSGMTRSNRQTLNVRSLYGLQSLLSVVSTTKIPGFYITFIPFFCNKISL